MKLLSVAAEVAGIPNIETASFAHFESQHTPFHGTVAPVTGTVFITSAFPKILLCCDILRGLVT